MCTLLLILVADIILFVSILSTLIMIVLLLGLLRPLAFVDSSNCFLIYASYGTIDTGTNGILWDRL